MKDKEPGANLHTDGPHVIFIRLYCKFLDWLTHWLLKFGEFMFTFASQVCGSTRLYRMARDIEAERFMLCGNMTRLTFPSLFLNGPALVFNSFGF